MADSSADSSRLPSWRTRLAAALHWRSLIRLPLHLSALTIRLLVVAFFVLAISFLLLRHVAAPQIAQQRERIEQALTQELGLKVQIASLNADWQGLRPELSIRGLRVFDHEDRVALELPQVEVSVAWSSLLYRRLTLQRLEIIQPELNIRRTADGKLFIAGLQIENKGGGKSGFGDFVLDQHQVLIRNARLVWTDEQRDAPPLALDRVNLRLENSGSSHRFALQASPPAAYSANLDVRGDLHGTGFDRLEDWRGTFYLSLDEADLAVWQKWLDYPLALPRGRGGLRTWVSFDGKHVEGMTADVALADVSMRFAKNLPMLDLASLQGRVKLTADEESVSFSADNLALATPEGLHIGPTRMGFDYELGDAQTPAKGRFTSGELDVRVLAQLAGSLPLPEEVAHRLAEIQPGGRIVDVKLDWEKSAGKLAHFNVDASLEGLTLKPMEGLPGVNGLAAQVKGTERGGSFKFQMKDGVLHVPTALREGDVPISSLNVAGRWGYEVPKGGKDEFLTLRIDSGSLANPHLTGADISGYWQARADSSGYLELRAQAKRASLVNIWRYMPLHTAEYVPQWMHESLQDGSAEDVRFQFVGDLDRFPFNKSPGTFRLECRLVDAKLATFAHGWPGTTSTQGSLVLDRQRLTIMLNKGLYQGVVLHDVKVEIPDLMDAGKQILTVDGKGQGPTSDFLAYVNASHLGDITGSFTREMRTQGNGELDMHINVPLHESINTTVKGSYRFTGNTMKLIPSLPDFLDTSGTLGFTEKGLTLTATEANFLGKRMRASGLTEADGTMRFDAQGMVSVAGLRRLVPNPTWSHMSGESYANVVIRVRKALTEVTVDSNFVGITSDLAQPLGKDAADRWPVRFGLRIDGREGSAEGSTRTWRVKADSRLDVSWAEQCRDNQCNFLRGAVASGEDAQLPSTGWRFSGSLKNIDVAIWQPVIEDLLAGIEADNPGTSSSQAQSELAVVGQVGELLVAGHRFRNVSGRAQRHDGNWTLHVDGPDLAGDLSWRDTGNGSLHARLSRLSLQPIGSDTDGATVSAVTDDGRPSRQLPSMDVVAEQFRIRNMDLGKLTLLAASDEKRWLLKSINLSAADMSMMGLGSWQRSSGTHIDFKITSDDAGSMLGRFGLPNSVRKGKVDFKGSIGWRGMPTTIDYGSLNGTLELKASDGQFTEMEPGAAGRLLGILSLQSLQRRVMGNFDDVIAKGFAFDSINGDMRVESGLLQTGDLEVRGPAARIYITGNTDLGREVHNLHLKVQPTMSDSVAIGVIAGQWATGVVNPVLGLGIYLGQKILRDPVEKIFSYELEVTGPWSDPKVEKKSEKLEDKLESITPFGSSPAVTSGGKAR